MASIQKRGDYQWQAVIRRKGFPTQTKTFETKAEADRWARRIESKIDQDDFPDLTEAKSTTLGEALDRYGREVTPKKRGAVKELARIRQLRKHPLVARSLASLRASDFREYLDERLQAGRSNSTINRELALFSTLFTTIINKWEIPLMRNPMKDFSKESEPAGRDRRLTDEEWKRFWEAVHHPHCRAAAGIELCSMLAIETGMRAGNIVALEWSQIDFENHVIHLSMTKNGEAHDVAMNETIEAYLKALPRPIHGGRLTTFHDSNGLSSSIRDTCKRAKIKNFRFHDFRHEAASRFAPYMEPQVLMKVMGWKSLAMVARYYNPKADEKVDAVREAERLRREKAERSNQAAA